VTRFYAGCYSKGELASLIDRLQELAKDPEYGITNHPRILGAILLSDWVFSQYPKSVSEVLNLILAGSGFRFILTANSRRAGRSNPVVLPKGCGKQEIIDRCFSFLGQRLPLEYALDVIDLLKSNASADEIYPLWLDSTRAVESSARTDWLGYGLQLGCLSNMPIEQLEEIVSEHPLDCERVDPLYRAKRLDFLESNEARFSIGLRSLLCREMEATSTSPVQGTLDLFAHCLDVNRYAIAFKFPHSVPLSATWNHAEPHAFSELRITTGSAPSWLDAAKCFAFIAVVQKQSERPTTEWATELSPWDAVVEEGRRHWGDEWAFYHIANIASGIKSPTETCTDCPDPFDDTKSLCRRSRYARLRAGTATWWPKQFHAAQSILQKLHVSQIWLTWASENTIIQSFYQFDSFMADLQDGDWGRFFDSVERGIALTLTQSGDRLLELKLPSLPESISPRSCVALALQTPPRTQVALYRKYLADYTSNDPRILQFCQNSAVLLIGLGDEHWEHSLGMIAQCFAKGVVSKPSTYQQFMGRAKKSVIPIEHAIHIVKYSDQYPGFLVAAAESTCREDVARKIVPVGQVAEKEGWFAT
jgi:hypothetical protein